MVTLESDAFMAGNVSPGVFLGKVSSVRILPVDPVNGIRRNVERQLVVSDGVWIVHPSRLAPYGIPSTMVMG